MKRLLVIILALVLCVGVLAMAGCAKKEEPGTTDTTATDTATDTGTDTGTATDTGTDTGTGTGTGTGGG